MRRLLRWAFNFAAVVSAGLCLVLACWWVRSFEPSIWRVTAGRGDVLLFWIDSDCGAFLNQAYETAPDHSTLWVYRHLESGTITATRQFFGCTFQTGTADENEFNPKGSAYFTFSLLQVPMWPLSGDN